jgi:hypothetical protein
MALTLEVQVVYGPTWPEPQTTAAALSRGEVREYEYGRIVNTAALERTCIW